MKLQAVSPARSRHQEQQTFTAAAGAKARCLESPISGTSTGKGRKPSVKVKDAKGNILAENDDYTVSYSILPAENPSAPPGCL